MRIVECISDRRVSGRDNDGGSRPLSIQMGWHSIRFGPRRDGLALHFITDSAFVFILFTLCFIPLI